MGRAQVHKILRATIASIIAFLIVAQAVYAATYSASITIVESGAVAYTKLPLIYSLTTANLTGNGFMEADALDSRVLTNASVELPHLFGSDKLLFVTDLGANSTVNNTLTLGNADLTFMPIITGYGGYITTADAAAVEPGDDFELEIKGYFLTPASEQTLVSKGAAFSVTVDENMDITTGVPVDGINVNIATSGASFPIYGANWEGQTFEPTATGTISKVVLQLAESGNPAGNFVVGIFAVDGANKPTGAALCSATQTATTIGALGAKTFNFAPGAVLTSGVRYACVCTATAGDAGNYISWYMASTPSGDVYPDGQNATSTDSGATWGLTDINDHMMVVYLITMSAEITASGVATGVHTLKITADTTDLNIYYDGGLEDTAALAGASIMDVTDAWVFLTNNIMPYADYIKLTIGGTLIVYYQPIAIISGTTMPDREGAAQNGTITWGTNPADIDITLGALVSESQPAPALPPSSGEPVDVLPPITQPGWASQSEVALQSNPFYPIVDALSTFSGFSDMQVWIFFASGLVVFGMILVFKFMPHILAVSVSGGVLSGFFVAIGIYPFWVVFIFILATLGILFKEITSQGAI